MIFKLIVNEINRILGENFEIYLNENLSSNFGIPSTATPNKVLGSVVVESGTFRPLTGAQGFETGLSLYLFIPCDPQTLTATDNAVGNLISIRNGIITQEEINDGETIVTVYDYSWQFGVPTRYAQVERINGNEYFPMALTFTINVTQSLIFSNANKIYISDKPFSEVEDMDKVFLGGLLNWSVSGVNGVQPYIDVNEEQESTLPTGAIAKISVDGLIEKSQLHKDILSEFRLEPQKTYYVRRVLDFGENLGETTEDYFCVLETCMTSGTQTQFATFSLRFTEVPEWFGGDLNG